MEKGIKHVYQMGEASKAWNDRAKAEARPQVHKIPLKDGQLKHITLQDPEKPGRNLVDSEVGFMRDDMVVSPDGRILGSYTQERTPDGILRPEIEFHPIDRVVFVSTSNRTGWYSSGWRPSREFIG